LYILEYLYIMIVIDVTKEKSLESALRTYKHKVQKVKQVQQLRERKEFVKPSVIKRKENQPIWGVKFHAESNFAASKNVSCCYQSS
jgi:small subunit ribosomal protein S21